MFLGFLQELLCLGGTKVFADEEFQPSLCRVVHPIGSPWPSPAAQTPLEVF